MLATFPHRRDAVATVNGPLCVRPSGLYGTTGSDGPNAGGALFRLRPPTAPGGSWTVTIVHYFAAGEFATSRVVAGAGGVLYGTTTSGGPGGGGIVYSLAPGSSVQ